CADFAVKGPNEIGAGSADDSNAGPAFTRISTAVCEVLDDLLKQIVPPPSVSDNYRLAREQIVKGLNWYELVSTLEQISVRSEEHTSELQSRENLVCRLQLEKKEERNLG